MYFADIPQAELDDAGPSLKKVLQFKKKFERDRIGLHGSFETPRDLVSKVSDMLHEVLLEDVLDRVTQSPPTGAPAIQPTDEGTALDEASDHTPDEAQEQVIQVLDGVKAVLTGRDIKARALDRDRLEFFSAAVGIDRALVGTHLINRLYRRVARLELVQGERVSWARTMLADIGLHQDPSERVIPGWALLAESWDDVSSELLEYAAEEGPVGQGAMLQILRSGLYPASLWEEVDDEHAGIIDDQWARILNANPDNDDAVRYLLKGAQGHGMPSERLRELVERLSSVSGLHGERATLLKEIAEALNGNLELFAERLLYSLPATEMWSDLELNIEHLGDKSINRLASRGKDSSIRVAAITKGLLEGSLDDATLKTLLFEGNPKLSELIIDNARGNRNKARHLLSLVQKPPSGKVVSARVEAELRAISMSAQEIKSLVSERDWDSRPWEALTYSRPDEMLHDARALLTNDRVLRQRLANVLSPNLVSFVLRERKQGAAALIVRVSGQKATDQALVLEWFRSLARDGFIPDDAWRVILNLAEVAVNAIPDHFFEPYSDVLGFGTAASLLETAIGPLVAPVLARSERAWEREPADVWLIRRPERTVQELKNALHDESPSVRVAACSELTKRLESTDLKALLSSYISGKNAYWYNVVVLLDEYLFLPKVPSNLITG
ncbi:hypothetical protein [Curtobacterium sp. L1-20]|uniref:hypothetical protein n=1 Tax=Curtobacterium sp. L1-20 TaxID=3138181 RepID=UPI003B530468